MDTRISYESGEPCWIDLMVADPETERNFYAQLFGWGFTDPIMGAKHYTNAVVDGRVVAGLMPRADSSPMPTFWTMYIAVPDVDAACESVTRAGGQVLQGPGWADPETERVGKFAFISDPGGAMLGVWQHAEFSGAERVNTVGAWSWEECYVNGDPEPVRRFYREVFGWSLAAIPESPEFDYTLFSLPGSDRPLGGILPCSAVGLSGVPSHWMQYFGVTDVDATAALAVSLGGKVAAEPKDSPYGRFVVLTDPEQAPFIAIAMDAASE